jgi:hypothetical protein
LVGIQGVILLIVWRTRRDKTRRHEESIHRKDESGRMIAGGGSAVEWMEWRILVPVNAISDLIAG